MWAQCRRAISDFTLNSAIYCSIALGILPYGYNRPRRGMVPSKAALVYSVCIDLLIICMALYAWPSARLIHFERIRHWSLLELLSQFVILVNVSALLNIMWTNWSEYKCILGLLNEYSSIERSYFIRHTSLMYECAAYEHYIILKGLAMLLKNLSFVYVALVLFKDVTWPIVAVHIMTMLLVNIISLVVMHFYIFILVTYRYIWIMRERLKCIANDLGLPHSSNLQSIRYELSEITVIYMRLLRFCEQFVRIYGKQMLLCISGVAGVNVLTLILLLFVWREVVHKLNVAYSWYVLVVNTLDFWLIISACELALGTAFDFVALQRSFSNYAPLSAALERELEMLALVCATSTPQFRLCGLLDLDYSTGLKVLMTTILYVIYLVQMNYKNL
ncbi:putative gustatory receptor 22a [Ceratitis capitata]|nr:putative gustatory receptor 22a [Ceratitis capitata]